MAEGSSTDTRLLVILKNKPLQPTGTRCYFLSFSNLYHFSHSPNFETMCFFKKYYKKVALQIYINIF